MKAGFRKDASLDLLAERINVAQFVSFSPGAEPIQQYCRIAGVARNETFPSIRAAIDLLLRTSLDQSVNVRSFKLDDARSHEFIYGVKVLDEVEAHVRRLASAGFYVIVNETIDIHDGGVSGVIEGGTIEFSPDDTPRCVEKPGVASLPVELGLAVLERVYGVELSYLAKYSDARLEFSVHPTPRGWKHSHVLGWEMEGGMAATIEPSLSWPNNFSRHLGDKAYGLLIADALGLRVPQTTVLARRVAPFVFGADTGSRAVWLRTCPREQVPGKFTTSKGWVDPFKLLASEDPSGDAISSVLAQAAVESRFSGGLIVTSDGSVVVEGRRGEGEVLMRGIAHPEALPREIVRDVRDLYERIHALLGAVRFEWVHDGKMPWIVQLHRGATESLPGVLVPGEAARWVRFEASEGLEALRALLPTLKPNEGLELHGQVGLTSHVADVVRKAKKPARILA